MDIDRLNFPSTLLEILEAISEAHFVSFDLELSGVPVRKPGGGGAGRPPLAQRYEEVREAAIKYQILQIGITCAKETLYDGTYELKPYNINLSPVIEERLEIERIFAFHSGAVEFLNGVQFNFQTPFQWGVPYLSRDETKQAKSVAQARFERNRDAVANMDIKPEDTETIELMRKVRQEIVRWQEQGTPYPEYTIVGSKLLSNKRQEPPYEDLSRFEKRVIHQLVRSEFPELVSIPRRGMVQISHFDQEREDRIARERKTDAESRIHRHVGFRWVIEALCGSDLQKLDVRSFATNPDTGEPSYADMTDLQARFSRVQYRLKNKPRVLVGHNLFLDLIYLYSAFIGEPPETLEEFQRSIHEFFPTIVDTKYMATHSAGSVNPTSTLQQTAEELEDQIYPSIATHKRHGKYEHATAFHEAGYDSLLTATIAIRLSAKLGAADSALERTAKRREQILHRSSSDTEDGGVQLSSAKGGSSISSTVDGVRNILLAPFKPTSSGSSKQRRSKDASKPILASGRFAHATAFDVLQEQDTDGNKTEDDVLQFDDLAHSDTNGAGQQERQGEEDVTSSGTPSITTTDKLESPRVMPRFESDFWQVYGNKLRVFGTLESVCQLAG